MASVPFRVVVLARTSLEHLGDNPVSVFPALFGLSAAVGPELSDAGASVRP
jgi:hypothetical protein